MVILLSYSVHHYCNANLSGTNPKIGFCRGNRSINRLLVKPLMARPLAGCHGNPCLNGCCPLNSFTDSTSMSLFVENLKAPGGLGVYIRHSTARMKCLYFTPQVPMYRLVPLSLGLDSGLQSTWSNTSRTTILKQCLTDRSIFELWKFIDLIASSKRGVVVSNFPRL